MCGLFGLNPVNILSTKPPLFIHFGVIETHGAFVQLRACPGQFGHLMCQLQVISAHYSSRDNPAITAI